MSTIQSVSKALAGAIVTALVSYAAHHNIIFNADTSAALTTIVAAIVGFVVVYLSPKNKGV